MTLCSPLRITCNHLKAPVLEKADQDELPSFHLAALRHRLRSPWRWLRTPVSWQITQRTALRQSCVRVLIKGTQIRSESASRRLPLKSKRGAVAGAMPEIAQQPA